MATDQLTSAAFTAQLTAQSSAAQAKATSGSMSNAEAKAAAEEFEAVFLQTMLSPMFSGTSPSEPFGGGFAEDTWKGLLVEEYAKTITASGGVGVSEAIYSELISLQEQSNETE